MSFKIVNINEGFTFYNGQLEYKDITFRNHTLENFAFLQGGTFRCRKKYYKKRRLNLHSSVEHCFNSLEHKEAYFKERLLKLL